MRKMARSVALWGAVVLGILAVGAGAAATRAQAGPVQAPAGRQLFDYRQAHLTNGLQVITLEDFSCPIVAVQVWYKVGSKDEDPNRQGFAHMFEHMMFRGTDRLGPTDHFELIRRTGGWCNGYTNFDHTVYLEQLPADQIELAFWLEAERMSFLKIDQEAFDTERKVVEEERRMGRNQPYGTLVQKGLAEVFHVHPYRWSPIGNIAHLRATSVPELRAFWRRYYVPNNAALVIVGAVQHAEALRLAEKYFGWIPRCPDVPRVTVREPALAAPRTVTIREDSAPAPLVGLVYRTVPLVHDDCVVLEMLSTILGGGQSSRLYRHLVADTQLAVSAMSAAFSLEQDGALLAGAVLSPLGGQPANVREALEAQIARLRDEKVTDGELTKARNQLLRGTVVRNLRIDSKARLLGHAAVTEGDVSRVNDVLERMRKVTPDDIRRVARTYLAPQRALVFHVERNLMGTVMGGLMGKLLGKKDPEEAAPITAKPETDPPPPGRQGAHRPAGYPARPPMAKLTPAQVLPGFASRRLANGLKVLVVENHEVPYVTVRLGLRAGAWTEEKPGTASLAAGMLTRGTAGHSEAQLAEELETYAISLGGSADMDNCSVSAGCLTEHLERTIGLMGEVVRQPTFPPEEFLKLRKQVRTGLAISAETPAYLAGRELSRRLFGDHPYARDESGEVKDLDRLTADDLKAWWARSARPEEAVLILAGDVSPDRAVELGGRAFGDWKVEAPPRKVDLPPPPGRSATRIYLVDRPGTMQAQIRLGQLAIGRQDPAYLTTEVIDAYFGQGFGARLNKKVRVEKGLTYGIGGGYSAGRFAGRFTIGTFTKNATAAEAVRTILQEIERLRAEGPSDEELSRVQSAILGGFAGRRETPQAVAGDLWLVESEGLPADYFERMLSRVSRATADECLRVARETLDPARMVIVVVGDAKVLKGDLAEIAPVTVVQPPSTRGASAAAESTDRTTPSAP